jgi:hypothetical protein
MNEFGEIVAKVNVLNEDKKEEGKWRENISNG